MYIYIYINIEREREFFNMYLWYIKFHGVMRGITSNTYIQRAMWDQLSDIITFTNLLPIFKFANIS